MRLNYDRDADALAIVLAEGTVERTVQLDAGTLVDVDASDQVLTIEVIAPARIWPLEEIEARWNLAEDDRRVLRNLFVPRGRYPFAGIDQVASEDREAELVV